MGRVVVSGAVGYEIKDSGKRAEYEGGMVRDTAEGKDDWSNLRIGPMPRRIVRHLTAGRTKYPDPSPGVPNWTLGRGIEVWLHARESHGRHNDAYLAGLRDEDHAAAIYFNINVMEYVRQFFTGEEEAQAQAIEALQRAQTVEEAMTEDRKRRYLGQGLETEKGAYRVKAEDASLETPVQTGRRLLNLRDDPVSNAYRDDSEGCLRCPKDDGTGLDENGDAK